MPSSSLTARREAAESFRPAHVDCLLVAEAPPADKARYFYFETVATQDSLYLEVSKALFFSLDTQRLRANKARYLSRLRDQGMWLVDLAEDPSRIQGISPTTSPLGSTRWWSDVSRFILVASSFLPARCMTLPFNVFRMRESR